MQIYTSKVSLQRFRADALHREAMCRALEEDSPGFHNVAETASLSLQRIDARTLEVRQASDTLVRYRAIERASKLRAAVAYAKTRRDLAAEAARLAEVLLPTPPSVLKKVGIGRVAEIVTLAAKNLERPECPSEVREEHLPLIKAELEKLRAADRAEDDVRASFAALRAAVVLFKAELEIARVKEFAALVQLVGSRADADEFFLPARARSGSDDAEDEDELQTPEEPSVGGGAPTS
jgi:hypothetical protein